MEQKRLYKSRTNKMIGGVCGGIGEYINLDPTVVRLAFVLLTIFGFAGVVAYIIALIVMPEDHSNHDNHNHFNNNF